LSFGDTNTNGVFLDTITATNTFLTGGHDAGDAIWTTGGTTTVTLHNPGGGDTVLFDQFNDNSDFFFTTAFDGQRLAFNDGEDAVAVTDDGGFVNKAGAHTTTIANFVVVGSNPGANDDILSFSPDSWGFLGTNQFGFLYLGLVNGDLSSVQEETFANMFLASGSNQTLNPDSNVVVYELNSFAGGLTALENALGTSGGAIKFVFAPTGNNSFDFLFAYNNGSGGVNISDIQFEGNGSQFSTQFLVITAAHNLVTLTGITGGVGSLFSEYLAHHSNIFFND